MAQQEVIKIYERLDMVLVETDMISNSAYSKNLHIHNINMATKTVKKSDLHCIKLFHIVA